MEKPQGTAPAHSGGGTTGTPEQRRHYRVSSGFEGILEFALILSDGAEHPAELVDVSAGGACLRWPLSQLVVLNVGQQIRLRVTSRGSKAPLILTATVRWLGADDDRGVRYGVEFDDMEEQYDQINPALRWIFNRRGTPR